MQSEIITTYCICVEYLAAIGYRDDRQATMTTAEVMTIALVAARCPKVSGWDCLPSWPNWLNG